jgi:hypothetical protein
MSMVLGADQFGLLQGQMKSFARVTESGATMNCFFCPDCGNRIYNQKSGAESVVILKPGMLDDPGTIAPSRQLWTEKKQGWIELPGLEGFKRQPG